MPVVTSFIVWQPLLVCPRNTFYGLHCGPAISSVSLGNWLHAAKHVQHAV